MLQIDLHEKEQDDKSNANEIREKHPEGINRFVLQRKKLGRNELSDSFLSEQLEDDSQEEPSDSSHQVT